jgi:hypothetical protein
VGSYPITLSGGSDPKYAFTLVPGTLTVSKAIVTATADNKTKLYGSVNPALTISYSGFVDGQTVSALVNPPTVSTTAGVSSGVGGYPITLSGGSDPNYAVTLVPGTLTVSPVTLTVQADAQSRAYGQINPVLTATISGFVDGENSSVVNGAASLSTTATAASPVGFYVITANRGTLSAANYIFSPLNGQLTVTQAALTATADNKTRVYGAANPALTISYSGFVNGQTAGVLANPPTASTTANVSSGVGSYAITLSGGSDPNYAFTLAPGSLAVTPAVLTITASDASRAYGVTNPVFSGTVSPLLNNDGITATYSTTATQVSPAGTYSIVPTVVDPQGKARDYAITLQDGTLTITPGLTFSATPGFYVMGSDPVLVDTNATVSDGGSLNFGGATLTVSVVTNATAADCLSLDPEGTDPAQIGVDADTLTCRGAIVGTFTAKTNGLVFSFTTNATSSVVTALLRQLTFATTNTATSLRVIEADLCCQGTTLSAQRVLTLDRPPVAGPVDIWAAANVTVSIPFSQVLTNVADPDGRTLSLSLVSGDSTNGGQITASATAFSYAPPAGKLDSDQFTYLAQDGVGGQSTGTITIHFVATLSPHVDLSNTNGGGAVFTEGGTPGSVYEIQVSTNLVDWTVLATVTATSTGIIEILDTDARNYPQRFYRAVPQ